jgi:transketolase
MHGKAVAPGEDFERAMAELDETARRVGAKPDGRLRPPPFVAEAAAGSAAAATGDGRRPSPPLRRPLPSLPELLERLGRAQVLAKGEMPTRDAYGLALRALAEHRPDVVALDGDVGNSTRADKLEDVVPSRYVECRIAEQAMVSCAAGLAAGGKRPFLASFGKFLTRAYDQVEMALVSGLPIQVVGSHVGVTPAADGPSQMALSDAAWLASLARTHDHHGRPLMPVLTPSDGWSAYALTLAMAEHDGACALRLMRTATPLLYDGRVQFTIGGHRVVREGSDVLLAAWGTMLHVALDAARRLAKQGVEATVVDLYCIPFDARAIAELARENGGQVLTLEDNYGGALGAAVSEALTGAGDAFRVESLCVPRVPKSGRKVDDVLAALHLSAEDVEARVLALVDEPAPSSAPD